MEYIELALNVLRRLSNWTSTDIYEPKFIAERPDGEQSRREEGTVALLVVARVDKRALHQTIRLRRE